MIYSLTFRYILLRIKLMSWVRATWMLNRRYGTSKKKIERWLNKSRAGIYLRESFLMKKTSHLWIVQLQRKFFLIKTSKLFQWKKRLNSFKRISQSSMRRLKISVLKSKYQKKILVQWKIFSVMPLKKHLYRINSYKVNLKLKNKKKSRNKLSSEKKSLKKVILLCEKNWIKVII